MRPLEAFSGSLLLNVVGLRPRWHESRSTIKCRSPMTPSLGLETIIGSWGQTRCQLTPYEALLQKVVHEVVQQNTKEKVEESNEKPT
ncbi:hypothetical protein BDV09DRAFT_35259 [Aspergillus tetrazonus]